MCSVQLVTTWLPYSARDCSRQADLVTEDGNVFEYLK